MTNLFYFIQILLKISKVINSKLSPRTGAYFAEKLIKQAGLSCAKLRLSLAN